MEWEDQSWGGEEQDPYEVKYSYYNNGWEYVEEYYRSGMDESEFPEDGDNNDYFKETGGIYDPNFEAGDNWI